MNVPDEFHYSDQHEWIQAMNSAVEVDVGVRCRVGITEFASEALGDVIFVDAPAVGSVISAGDACGEIESTKSVSDLVSPVTGSVVAVNEAVLADPSMVNADPHGLGWLFEVEVSEPVTGLLTPAQYRELVAS